MGKFVCGVGVGGLGDEQTLRWTHVPPAGKWVAPTYFNTRGMQEAKLRSANVFKGKAVLSDFCEDSKLIKGVHKSGVNVLYSSYAVKWVPFGAGRLRSKSR